MFKRLFDIISSIIVLLLLAPFLIIIIILIPLESKGSPFFVQDRIGRNGQVFGLMKLRSMRTNTESKGQLTVGEKDPRITRMGAFIRKFKIDEFPQLLNVIVGQMSIVGPRPEVKKYVDLYNNEQRKVLQVRPGLSDYASIEYINENELLGRSENPEKTYIDEIMPAKLQLNLKYIEDQSMLTDLKIIFRTFRKII